MATHTVTSCNPSNGTSGFRIKRPLITTSGFVSDVEPIVKGLLDELNHLLGKRIFTFTSSTAKSAFKRRRNGFAVAAQQTKPPVIDLLQRTLTPKRIPPDGKPPVDWDETSLAFAFNDAEEADGKNTLSDYIDVTAELAALKYAFQNNLSSDWLTLDYNTKTVLDGYPAIVDYLVAYAFHIMNIQDVCGLRNFIYSNRGGARSIINYAVLSGARSIIDSEQLNVPDYNQDDSPLLPQLNAAGLSLSSASFKTSAQAVINDYIFNAAQSLLIDQAEKTIGPVPPEMKSLLIQFMKKSRVPITKDNVDYFLPLFISQISGPPQIDAPGQSNADVSDKDFDVTLIEDDKSAIQISKSAVKCAAQLYYDEVVSEELNVLGAADYFTHKYLLRTGMEIQDPVLRDDLQTYVFSGRFTDLRTKRVVDRTKPAERQMFYRQVFDYGTTQVPDDLVLNAEFPKLWKVLMLESARYLERAQASPNPDSFVSRQNVMQAVEDLQYNLSTSCTGMAIVVTPLIYAELDFVIRRIFMHNEVLTQLVPSGPRTWWKAIEVLTLGMSHARLKSTVLYNKAKLGNAIIRAIADYNPATFEDDKSFSAFISDVDAYITTQSILQEALTDDLKADQEDAPKRLNLVGAPGGPPVAAAAKTGTDEWDF